MANRKNQTGVLSAAQKHVNSFDQAFKCFARHLALDADSHLFSVILKQDLTVDVLLVMYVHFLHV